MNVRTILGTLTLFSLVGPVAMAQSAPAPATNPPTIQDRKTDQQDRIAQGIRSDQLTPGETKNLETKEAGINKEENTMRSQDDGHLTSADRTKLNNQQNHLSNQIYNDKHNAATDHFGNGEVGQRQQMQQNRISQGVKSGQLTAGETSRLERQQQGINREVGGMREANGGKLSHGQRAMVNRQQNRASGNIYAKKHNARAR